MTAARRAATAAHIARGCGPGRARPTLPPVIRRSRPSGTQKNGALTPQEVLPGSHRKVWWKCAQGHSWQAMIKSRVQGCGLSGVRQPGGARAGQQLGCDLSAAVRPVVSAQEWRPDPSRCRGWFPPQGMVAMRARPHLAGDYRLPAHSGAGCPVCTGKQIVPGENDLASRYPQIAAEWDTARNAPLTPEQVSPYSNRGSGGGARWAMNGGRRSIPAPMPGAAVPTARGNLFWQDSTTWPRWFPRVAAQWHPTRNGTLTPQMVTPGSKKKVWWQCPEGHVWQAVVGSRAGDQRCGCPVCAGRVRTRRRDRYASFLAEKDAPYPKKSSHRRVGGRNRAKAPKIIGRFCMPIRG